MKSGLLTSGWIIGLTLNLASFTPPTASAAEHAESAAASADPAKPRKLTRDTAISEKTESLGQKLFFGGLKNIDLGSFKARYEKMEFADHKNIIQAINDIKPWREGDSKPTVEQEMPIAEAIADMFDTMQEADAHSVVEAIAKAKDGIKKTQTDSQYEEFVKRLWDAAQLKVPEDKWPDSIKKDEPGAKDKRLASFREAFIEARDKALDAASTKNALIKDAAAGNTAAKEKLFGSKTDKESFENNKWAIGENPMADVRNMLASGNQAQAMEMLKALSYKTADGWRMNINNAEGKPVTMEMPAFKPENAAQIANILNDEKMRTAKFVGWDHDEKSGATPWAWDAKTKTVGKKIAPTVDSLIANSAAAAPAAGSGVASAGANPSATRSPSQTVAGLVNSGRCTNCHQTKLEGGVLTNLGKNKQATPATDWVGMKAGLSPAEIADLKKFSSGQI